MIFPDYHLHTEFSSDCNEKLDNIILQAKAKGLSSICITDHYDMDFPIIPQEPTMDFNLDVVSYFNLYDQYRKNQYNDFDIRIGVELGIMPSTTEKLNQYVLSHPELDFTICSLHVVDGLDPYYPEYFNGKTDFDAYYHYFDTILQCVKEFKHFNVCGHIDYIMRYGRNKADNFNIKDYRDLFSELFKILVQEGKGIEINTGSLYRGLDFPHPHIDILKMYKNAGGEIITVGSDAHHAEHVGYGFDVAKDLLLNLGFKYFTTFKEQKPTFEVIQ